MKWCDIGVTAQYLGFVQVMACGEKLESLFCISLFHVYS